MVTLTGYPSLRRYMRSSNKRCSPVSVRSSQSKYLTQAIASLFVAFSDLHKGCKFV